MTDNKTLHDFNQKKQYSTAAILPVCVSLCLGKHEDCTGFYSDNQYQFLLKCNCPCHQCKEEAVK